MLTRYSQDSILIGPGVITETIEIKILKVHRDKDEYPGQVVIGLEVPKEIPILRKELLGRKDGKNARTNGKN